MIHKRHRDGHIHTYKTMDIQLVALTLQEFSLNIRLKRCVFNSLLTVDLKNVLMFGCRRYVLTTSLYEDNTPSKCQNPEEAEC